MGDSAVAAFDMIIEPESLQKAVSPREVELCDDATKECRKVFISGLGEHFPDAEAQDAALRAYFGAVERTEGLGDVRRIGFVIFHTQGEAEVAITSSAAADVVAPFATIRLATVPKARLVKRAPTGVASPVQQPTHQCDIAVIVPASHSARFADYITSGELRLLCGGVEVVAASAAPSPYSRQRHTEVMLLRCLQQRCLDDADADPAVTIVCALIADPVVNWISLPLVLDPCVLSSGSGLEGRAPPTAHSSLRAATVALHERLLQLKVTSVRLQV